MGRGRPTQGRPVGGDVGGDARASADLPASPNCCLGISGTWAGSAPAPAWGQRHLRGVSGTCAGSAEPGRGQRHLGGVSAPRPSGGRTTARPRRRIRSQDEADAAHEEGGLSPSF